MNSNQKGFTFLELLITLAMISIFTVCTLQTYQHTRKQYALQHVTQQLITTLQNAQVHASVLQQAMQLTPLENNWKNGWVLCAKKRCLPWVRLHKRLVNISWRGFDAKQSVSVYPAGDFHQMNGRFTLQTTHPDLVQQIVLNQVGRIRVV